MCNLHIDTSYIEFFSCRDKGVDLLTLRAPDFYKYALVLMDALFSDEEMAPCCFKESSKSTKPPLSREKTKLMEG